MPLPYFYSIPSPSWTEAEWEAYYAFWKGYEGHNNRHEGQDVQADYDRERSEGWSIK